MEEVRGGPAGPFEDLEVIRVEAGMSTARFCQLFDMPERDGTADGLVDSGVYAARVTALW